MSIKRFEGIEALLGAIRRAVGCSSAKTSLCVDGHMNSSSSTVRRAILPLFVLSIALPLGMAVRNLNGICLSEMAPLSDKALIEAAVEFNSRGEYSNGSGKRWKRMNIDGSRSSIAAFLATHPDCCSVSRMPYKIAPAEIFFTDVKPLVHLIYEKDPRI
jgi:hypothetical protein